MDFNKKLKRAAAAGETPDPPISLYVKNKNFGTDPERKRTE